jgi:hypothetical protein
MDWGEFFKSLPTVGWCVVFAIIAVIWFGIFILYSLVKNRDIKIKNFELMQKTYSTQKELHQTEGKNLLDNQTSNAHNLLKKIWIGLYEVGREKFHITDQTELFILEDIARLIEGRLNYEVKNDLTRNHITEKDDAELLKYSEAKAIGYYHAVQASLFAYNIQLPNYDLPKILTYISIEDYKNLFNEIYFNARQIAGGYRQ